MTKKTRVLFIIACAAVAGTAYSAQFWQAYCDTEKKSLNDWDNQEKVATNAKNYHLRNNSDHRVSINTK